MLVECFCRGKLCSNSLFCIFLLHFSSHMRSVPKLSPFCREKNKGTVRSHSLSVTDSWFEPGHLALAPSAVIDHCCSGFFARLVILWQQSVEDFLFQGAEMWAPWSVPSLWWGLVERASSCPSAEKVGTLTSGIGRSPGLERCNEVRFTEMLGNRNKSFGVEDTFFLWILDLFSFNFLLWILD